MKRAEDAHGRLLLALSDRHGEGFTVGQMRELMDEVEGGSHSYDLAWTLAGTLQRARVLDIAGSRPGPAGPIRVFRVARRARPPAPRGAAAAPPGARRRGGRAGARRPDPRLPRRAAARAPALGGAVMEVLDREKRERLILSALMERRGGGGGGGGG